MAKAAAVVGVLLAITSIAWVPTGAASTAPPPRELTVACALNGVGLMRYVSSGSQCTRLETAVPIRPGPVLVCIEPGGLVVKVASLALCGFRAQRLTLPSSGTVFFCAESLTGLLLYATSPSQCGSRFFPVSVTPAAPADAAPTVSGISPANGAAHVAVDSNVVITFSESVGAGASSFMLACPGGTSQSFTLSGAPGPAVTLDPTTDLPSGTTCTVTVVASQVSDSDSIDPPDHPAADYVFSFATDAAPALTSTSPADGAAGVDPSADIGLTFSEPVNAGAGGFGLDCDGIPQSFTASGDGTSTITLHPVSALPNTSRCTVRAIAGRISDVDTGDAPDHPTADASFSFTTRDLAPSVTATSPADGATGVTNTGSIAISFSESVAGAAGAFSIECPTGVPEAFTVSGAPGATLTLTPTNPLPEGATCTVTVKASQISDVDTVDPPDHPAADTVFSFTTASGVNTPPSVTVTAPVENGTFRFGFDIPFGVTVTDAEDGSVDCSEVQVTLVVVDDDQTLAGEATTGCTGVLHADAGAGFLSGNVSAKVTASYMDHGIAHNDLGRLGASANVAIRQMHQEVEFVVNQLGTSTAADNDGGPTPPGNPGTHRSDLSAGDYVELNGPFNLTKINSITYRVADAAAGRTAGSPLAAIEIHEDSATGPIVQTDVLTSTGGTATWQSENFPISISGTHDLFLVFRTTTGGSTGARLFNLNWVEFDGQGVGPPP